MLGGGSVEMRDDGFWVLRRMCVVTITTPCPLLEKEGDFFIGEDKFFYFLHYPQHIALQIFGFGHGGKDGMVE